MSHTERPSNSYQPHRRCESRLLHHLGHADFSHAHTAGAPPTGGSPPDMDPATRHLSHAPDRLENNQLQPVNLNSIATWNVGGWTLRRQSR